MDISSFPCTQLVFAFSLGWTLKEVNINGDFNQYIWAFSLGWTQETDVRVTSSSLLISSGKPEEVFPTNIFSVLNECPPLSTEPKLFNTIPTQFLLSHFYPHWFSTEPIFNPSIHGARQKSRRCSAKESSVLGKRIVGARQKNRRCSAKESTMLRGSSQYTLRYQLTAMDREVAIRDKT